MFTATDFDKLQQIMDESPENKALIEKLLASHQTAISTISHEIRNPLTLVYSTLQLIESQHPEVSAYKYWIGMREDIEYMKQLLEELSSYNNGEQLSVSSFDCSAWLKSIVLSFAVSLVESSITFTSRIEPDLPALTGDSIKLKEVLLNLLRNAQQAADKNGCIDLHAFMKDSALCITVEDDGCGIDPDHLASLFEPFVTHKQGGTGLGLSIARRIAHAHGGTLTVQSEPGAGAVFTLSLPIEKGAC